MNMYNSKDTLTRAQAALLTYSDDPQLKRHDAAVRAPARQEAAIMGMLDALMQYAHAHKQEFGEPVGEDLYVGSEIANIACALRALLNGSTGHLDGATVDRLILGVCLANGLDLEAL